MSSRDTLLARQRAWAQDKLLNIDLRGYVNDLNVNLWRPLSPRARAAFEEGSGNELGTKMLALHSSSALAVNFFDYWNTADRAELARALGLNSTITDISFEAKQSTGLRGNPPNLDVCMTLANGKVIAIESKFCEWLSAKSAKKPPFRAKYFEDEGGLWAKQGLANCQALAEDLRDGKEHFQFFDVPQMLKHALGLATQLENNFDLWYVYYEFDCPEATIHRLEVERFAQRAGREIRFRVLTYQQAFNQITTSETKCEASYLEYLTNRYFADGPNL